MRPKDRTLSEASKLKFNVCLIREDGRLRHRVLAHTQTGFTQLSDWLKKNHVGQVHACLQATSTYSEALATYLSDFGHLVSLVNRAATKASSGAQLSLTKTDKVDAKLIARFCQTQKPQLWTPAAPEVRELQALVRRLDSLIEMHMMESKRLMSGGLTAEVRVGDQGLGKWAEGAREIRDADHLRGDAQTHSSGLWSLEEWQAL